MVDYISLDEKENSLIAASLKLMVFLSLNERKFQIVNLL